MSCPDAHMLIGDLNALLHLFKVYGFGVLPLRSMLMAPKCLSFTWTLKDLRALENQMYMMIGWLPTSKVCTVIMHYYFLVQM